jgi:AmpE protein
LPGLAAWRKLEPVWSRWQALGSAIGVRGSGAAALLWLLLPVLLLLLLQSWLAARWWGLLALPYGVLMLFVCWGPRDLDADAAALAQAEDEPDRQAACRALGLQPTCVSSASGVAALFRAGLARWFGPLLWFVLLGGAGALLFRLAALACAEPPRRGAAMDWLGRLLNWPSAALMTLSLALVANFDAVLKAWRQWHAAPQRRWFGADLGFLDAAAQASVVRELQEDVAESADAAAEEGETLVAPPTDAVVPTLQAAVEDSLSLLRRILVLWMALLALAVLGGMAA